MSTNAKEVTDLGNVTHFLHGLGTAGFGPHVGHFFELALFGHLESETQQKPRVTAETQNPGSQNPGSSLVF
jgi:hypothetical protein